MINLGIDLGSTGLRAAYAASGGPTRFCVVDDNAVGWLGCEPAAAGPLPVVFPSVKSRIGSSAEAGKALSAVLDRLRRKVIAELPGELGRVVISVPARYGSAQRSALLQVARDAGLTDVGLITDTIAAVIGQSGTGTVLSVGLGYGGFELGLVRAVRGRYRVLGYEAGEQPGGAYLDLTVLQALLQVLRLNGFALGKVVGGDAGWLRLRADAQEIKERLLCGEDRSPLAAVGLEVEFAPHGRDQLVQLIAKPLQQRADALFEQSGMTRADVDTVLLVGGGTRPPALRESLGTLGAATVETRAEHLAFGALRHADQLSGRAVTDDEQVAVNPEPASPAAGGVALTATLVTTPGASTPEGTTPGVAPPDESDPLGRARRLIREGQPDEAATELRRIIAEAQDLLGEIVSGEATQRPTGAGEPSPASPSSSAEHLRHTARRLFAHGSYAEAVARAHQAWQREPTAAAVFDAMIDIHCEAAMAEPTVDKFADDRRWLHCALQHDPSSDRIRALLVERTFMHAKELHRLGRSHQAREAVEQVLGINPDHAEARTLHHRLTRTKQV